MIQIHQCWAEGVTERASDTGGDRRGDHDVTIIKLKYNLEMEKKELNQYKLVFL